MVNQMKCKCSTSQIERIRSLRIIATGETLILDFILFTLNLIAGDYLQEDNWKWLYNNVGKNSCTLIDCYFLSG